VTFVRKQCASAYERGGYIFLSPSSLTEGGLWVGSEPLVKLERREVDAGLLGSQLLEALNNSKVGVPHPARHEWEAVAKPLLDLAGVKTWDQFAQNSTLCEVERTTSTIRFIPTSNEGGQDGFRLDKQKAAEIPVPSPPEVVGRRLLDVLSLMRQE